MEELRMRERIKNALVKQMVDIHGSNNEGWWTDAQTLNEVVGAIANSCMDLFDNDEWEAA
ncbi:hypothetical protein CMO96_01675 [Candidatus Woesebacteria bacterium]|nr:hypothetical protein [Candidatus Woesebacteria bacterium]